MKRRRFRIEGVFRALRIDEELICTSRSYAGIASRLTAFEQVNQNFRVAIQTGPGLVYVRRTR